MPGPLAGVRVLDVTHVVAGAFCGMLLADLGADVVKVEPPGAGDPTRAMGGGFSPFGAVNRNKRSLAVDLRDERGAAALRRMSAQADVLVENFRPGTLDRLGLGYAALAAANPALVYCSISGFGATGPYRERGGFDLVAQGMSGIMSFTGEPGRPPVKVGVPIADLNAGLFGALGVVSAYVHRLRTGEGQHVDTSLLDAALAYTVWESALWWGAGAIAEPLGSQHRLAAPYQALRTADGWINVGAANQDLWERMCAVLGRPDLAADSRFADPLARLAHRDELTAALEEALAGGTTDEWWERFTAAGVPCGPIRAIDRVFDDPHVQARGMVVDLPGPPDQQARHLGVPVKLSRTPGAVRRPGPRLGEHSVEVLAAYGFTAAEIGALVDAGVVRAGGG